MEQNATKALLMAAGVLVGIIMLSLGVYLVTSMRNFSKNYNENLEQQQLTQFNSKFTVFENRQNISIHEIITLVNIAKEFNETNNLNKDDSQYIHIYAKFKRDTPIDLTVQDNNTINSLLNGIYIEQIYSTSQEIQQQGGQYRIQNIPKDGKKEKIIYYNCYSCKNHKNYKDYYINQNTGRIKYITFIFQEKYEQEI